MFPLLTLPPPSPPPCQPHHHHHHTLTVMSVNTQGQHPPNAHAIYTDMHNRNTLGPKSHPANFHSRLSEKPSSQHASQKMNLNHNLNPKSETNWATVVLTQLKQGTCIFYPVFFSAVVFLLPLFTERRPTPRTKSTSSYFFRNPRLTPPYTTASLHLFFLSPGFNFHSFCSSSTSSSYTHATSVSFLLLLFSLFLLLLLLLHPSLSHVALGNARLDRRLTSGWSA